MLGTFLGSYWSQNRSDLYGMPNEFTDFEQIDVFWRQVFKYVGSSHGQLSSTAELGAGGKPSTRSPPVGLVEPSEIIVYHSECVWRVSDSYVPLKVRPRFTAVMTLSYFDCVANVVRCEWINVTKSLSEIVGEPSCGVLEVVGRVVDSFTSLTESQRFRNTANPLHL